METRHLLIGTLLMTVVLGTATLVTAAPTTHIGPAAIEESDGSLLFIENTGQFHPDVHFQLNGNGSTIWLTEDAIWITIIASPPHHGGVATQGAHVRLSFAGANPHPRLEPFNRLDTVINYYHGNNPANWHTHVPVWGGIRYVDLFPGVDLELAGKDGHLTWTLVSHNSTTPRLRLLVEGAEFVNVQEGVLHLETTVGDFTISLPRLAGVSSTPVTPSVSQVATEIFEVTDPVILLESTNVPQANTTALLLSTFLGGSEDDQANGIAVDDNGAVYVTGWTFSPDFPTEGPGNTSSLSGNCDASVTKLAKPAHLFRPVYSTYLGGSYGSSGAYTDAMTESGEDIAVESGIVYVAGYTWSSDFPTTSGAFDTTFNGPATSPDASPERPGWDGFVVKLGSDGTLAYATYLGGSGYDIPGLGRGGGDDEARGIAVENGIIYVTGLTKSSDFPTTPGAYKRTYADVNIGLNTDVFVVKLNPAGHGSADLLYSTFVGGGLAEEGNDIAVDSTGTVYVTGHAHGHPYDPTMNSDFPTTPGAFDTELHGDNWDAFLFKLNPGGNGSADLRYSTLLGTDAGWDYGHAVAVDTTGKAYIVGNTNSPDFPTTPGAFDTTCGTDGQCNSTPVFGAKDDVFLVKLNPAGGGKADLLYSTFLGGGGVDGDLVYLCNIALDRNDEVYVTGPTISNDFPVTSNAYDDTYNGFQDAFVSRLRLQGKGEDDLVYSTFLGGTDMEGGLGIALESEGTVWISGYTKSSNFPTAGDAFDKFYGGNRDGFVAKMAVPPTSDLSTSTKRVNPTVASAGEIVTFTVFLSNTGLLSATVSFSDTLPATLLLRGAPTADSGSAPVANGQTITWMGTVNAGASVSIVYTAELTSSTVTTPTAFNFAEIGDGKGHVYVRRACVNCQYIFLPLVLKN